MSARQQATWKLSQGFYQASSLATGLHRREHHRRFRRGRGAGAAYGGTWKGRAGIPETVRAMGARALQGSDIQLQRPITANDE